MKRRWTRQPPQDQPCLVYDLGSGDEFDHPRYIRQNIRFSLPAPGIVVISLTPFPGTEVFDRLQKEGRLLHYDWEKYDLTHCVYRPQGMSPQELERFQSKAYLSIYLGKKWRLIPMLYKGFRSGTLKFRSVSTGFKALLRTFSRQSWTRSSSAAEESATSYAVIQSFE